MNYVILNYCFYRSYLLLLFSLSRHYHTTNTNGEGVSRCRALTKDGQTPLHVACLFGFLETVEALLEGGASMEAVDSVSACCLFLPACLVREGGASEMNEPINERDPVVNCFL